MADAMDPVYPLEPSLDCRPGDDQTCEYLAHQGPVVVDAMMGSHPTLTAVVGRSPCRHDAWLMEGCKTARGLPMMASTDPGPAVEECSVHIAKDHRPVRQRLSDVAGGNH